MPEIKQVLRQHYQQYALSEQQLNQIENLAKHTAGFSFRFALRSGVAFAVVCALLFFLWPPQPLRTRIATEMRTNHLKQEPLSIVSSDYAEIQSRLSQVRVNLYPLPDPQLKQMKLMGGRYCSLNGHKALQLRFKQTPTQRVYTLYLLPNALDLSELTSGEILKSNVKTQWGQDKKRFWGLIHDSEIL